MRTFSRRFRVPLPVEELFAWHERPGAFERLNPPWRPVSVIRATGGIEDGAQVYLRLPGGIPWHLTHRGYELNRRFQYEQVAGPFRFWRHSHLFRSISQAESELEDVIEYELPARLGTPFTGLLERELERLFNYRHFTITHDLQVHRRYPNKYTVLVTGAHGLIGTALCAFLSTGGHKVYRATRGKPNSANEVAWDPAGTPKLPEGVKLDAVIHLAGENIARRWTAEAKRTVFASRINSTKALASWMHSSPAHPTTFLCASAVGNYGDRGEALLDESSAPGEGFLAETCKEWEAAAAGPWRTINMRFGVVMSPKGGALKKMLPAFLAGAGGPLGSGNQWMSWIALDDLLSAILHCLHNPNIIGPCNFTSPEPVRNREFASILGTVLHRPARLAIPASALRLLFGAMAQEALLASSRVTPKALLNSGFSFSLPSLEKALAVSFGRRAPG